jgi:hypothetical protein
VQIMDPLPCAVWPRNAVPKVCIDQESFISPSAFLALTPGCFTCPLRYIAWYRKR